MARRNCVKLFLLSLMFLILLAACTGSKPTLTDGVSHLTLMSAVLENTSTVKTSSGQTISSLQTGHKLLTLTFSTKDEGNLISFALGKDMSGAIDLFLPGGFTKIYATDDNGEKYYAGYVSQTTLVIPVPENSTTLSLFVGDLAPIEIKVK